jgi:phosphatidate cytidylyltransferase
VDERKERQQRRPAEGVRIIGADEAQAAIDAGAAAGRRPDDEPRFGDVPPAPSGPRPPHRFPLPDSVDPAEAVPRPPVVAPVKGEDRPGALRATRPVTADDDSGDDATEESWTAVAGGDPPGESVVQPGVTFRRVRVADDASRDPQIGRFPLGEPAVGPAGSDDPTWGDTPVAAGGGEGDARSQPASAITGEQPPVEAQPGSGHGRSATRYRRWSPPPPPERGDQAEGAAGGEAGTAAAPAGSAGDGPEDIDAAEALPDGGETPESPLETTGDRLTVSGLADTELPHWADPPTGEVPRILVGDTPASDDEEDIWQPSTSRGLHWRGEAGDWDDVEEIETLGSEETRVGALDTSRSDESDLFSFDEAFERLEEERSGGSNPVAEGEETQVAAPANPRRRRRTPLGARPAPRRREGARPARRGRQGPPGSPPPSGPERRPPAAVGSRLAIGVGLVVLLLILYFVGPLALLALSALVIGGSAAEGYGMLQRAGFRPATLLGLVASVGIVLGAYWRGPAALPLIVAITFVASMLWYLVRIVEARPLANVAVTNVMFVWVGVLGSYAALLLRAGHGRGLFLGAVVTAVGADIVAYFGGRQMGSRQMAPVVSPGKTWEGATLGFLAAVVIGAIVGHFLTPWAGIKHGVILGAIIGVIAPIGDLAESMVKRDLGVKDSGTLLGGHGGLLDRFDSVLVALPAAYYLASYMHILK